MKRLYNGNALIQYGIIIALVVLTCVGIYAILGNNIVKYLSSFSSSIQGNQQAVTFKGSDGTVSSYQPGDLGGSTSAPVSECNGESCILDYGDYILEGIPANFSDESISSRGNDDITHVMASMVEQLEAENNPPSEDLTNLINLIKQAVVTNDKISDAEEIIEIGAFDVYVKPSTDNFEHPEAANELTTFKIILNNLADNKMLPSFFQGDPPLINMPAIGDQLTPQDVLFPDEAWKDPTSPYKDNLLETSQIQNNTDTLQDLKTQILDAASECGKTEQAEIIAYMIDISTKISNASVSAYNNDEEVVKVKNIVDNMDIDLNQELLNLAKDIDPSLGDNPLK